MNIDIAILGGMGPQAGANYFKILTDLFSTEKGDQEHPEVLLYSNSKIPDRAKSVDRNNDAPYQMLRESLEYLNSLNSNIINIACNSIHHWIYKYGLQNEFSSILTIDKATAQFLETTNEKQEFILLGTTATTNTSFYFESFKKHGLKLSKPSDNFQLEISKSIEQIKKNNVQNAVSIMQRAIKEMGENKYLIACTELSLIKKQLKVESNQYVDSAHCMAVMTYAKHLNLEINHETLNSTYQKIIDVNLVPYA